MSIMRYSTSKYDIIMKWIVIGYTLGVVQAEVLVVGVFGCNSTAPIKMVTNNYILFSRVILQPL